MTEAFRISATADVGPAIEALRERLGTRLPGALRDALNKTAFQARKQLVGAMDSRFKDPTPYTLNSVRVSPAYGQRLEAVVWVKDDAGKGTPAEKYLGPQVFGGGRREKRSERALQAAGILPAGMMTAPGLGASLDGYGNIERSQIVQILSYLRAFGEQGYRANMTDKRRSNLLKGRPSKGVRGFDYFALSRREGKLGPGVYKRTAYSSAEGARLAHLQRGGAKAVLHFIAPPTYGSRLPFFDLVRETVDANLVDNFVEKAALVTAR